MLRRAIPGHPRPHGVGAAGCSACPSPGPLPVRALRRWLAAPSRWRSGAARGGFPVTRGGVGGVRGGCGECVRVQRGFIFPIRLADLLHPQLFPDQRHNRLRGMHNVDDYTPLWLLQCRELACQQSWRHKVASTLRQPLMNAVIIPL